MKNMNKGPARRIRLRAVVAYPAVTVALVAAVALALTPFGPSQVMALAAAATPTETGPHRAHNPDPQHNRAHGPRGDHNHAPSASTTAQSLFPSPIPEPVVGTVAAPAGYLATTTCWRGSTTPSSRPTTSRWTPPCPTRRSSRHSACGSRCTTPEPTR